MSPYLQGHHDSVLRSHRWRTAENSAAYLLPLLEPGMDVLDVGCGPGTITSDFGALVGPSGSVLGIDSAEEVIALASASAPANVCYEVGDVMALAAADGSYDVVHAHQVLQHLTDPVGALREMWRVTRPGGILAVRDVDYRAMAWFPEHPDLDAWLETYRAVAYLHGAEPDAGRRLLSWALSAGLDGITPSASTWCFATEDDRRWWGSLHAERITRSRVAEQAVAAGVADADRLAAMAQAWLEWAEAPDGWFLVPHGELLCRKPPQPAVAAEA